MRRVERIVDSGLGRLIREGVGVGAVVVDGVRLWQIWVRVSLM